MKAIVVVFIVAVAVPVLARVPSGGLKQINQNVTKVGTTVVANLAEIVQTGETKELVVEILRGADLTLTDEKNRNLIHLAARAGRLDMIETLQRHGVDAQAQDADGLTASQFAEEAGHIQVVEFLSSEKQEAEEEMLSLIDAVIAGDLEAVELALADKHNVNQLDDLGRSALHHAAIRNNLEIAELLIDNDASLDIKDNQERTPAEYAEFMLHQEIFQLIDSKRQEAEQECAEMDEGRMGRVAEALKMRQQNKTCKRH